MRRAEKGQGEEQVGLGRFLRPSLFWQGIGGKGRRNGKSMDRSKKNNIKENQAGTKRTARNSIGGGGGRSCSGVLC